MALVSRLGVLVAGALVALVLAPPFVVDAAHRQDAPRCAPVATESTVRHERTVGQGLVVVEERTTRRAVGCDGRSSEMLLAARESYRVESGVHALEITWRANGTKQFVILDARGVAGAASTGSFETYPEPDLSGRAHRSLVPL